MCKRSREAFTLVELLVVVAIIGMLVALLLPAVQAARESGRRATCSNNLKQLSTACLLHLETHKHFPTGGWGEMWVGMPDRGVGRGQPGGWIYNILPFIDQENLHNSSGSDLLETPLTVLHCPSRRRVMAYPATAPQAQQPHPYDQLSMTRVAKTDYAINGGDYYDDTHFTGGPATVADASSFTWPNTSQYNGICYSRSEVQSAHIFDGQSNTYLLGEKYLNPDSYTTGTDYGDDATAYSGDEKDLIRWGGGANLVPLLDESTVPHPHHWGSPHSAGCNFVFCDGSVHLISFSIDPQTNGLLSNRRDGQALDASLF